MHKTPDRTVSFLLALLVVSAGTGLAPGSVHAAGRHEVDLEVGAGYDDNAFLTPADPYFDQLDETAVNPRSLSGFYVPLEVDGEYVGGGQRGRFVLDYRARNEGYLESDTSNADETYLRISPGYEWITGSRGRRNDAWFVAPFAGYKKEVFFDRDTGLEQTTSQDDAADRYTYTTFGAEAGYRFETGERIEWEVEARFEVRDYEDVTGISSLDHDRYGIGIDWEIDLHDRLKLYLDATLETREYDSRPSRNLSGQLLSTNPAREYRYLRTGASLRVRLSKHWVTYLDYDHTARDDDFQGYDDYDSDAFRIRLLVRDGDKRLRIAVRFRDRTYPNGFVFDLPLTPLDGSPNPKKDYDILDVDVRGEIPFVGESIAFVELDWRDQDTTDPRYRYDRLRTSAGLAWEF